MCARRTSGSKRGRITRGRARPRRRTAAAFPSGWWVRRWTPCATSARRSVIPARSTACATRSMRWALDTPQLAIGFNARGSRSQTSSESLTHSASQLTASGDIRLRATGNGATDANGRATSGDITITGSTLSAGGTAALDAQRSVVLQASTDTYQESSSASSSGSHFSTAGPSWGDLGRNVGGGPNSSGVGLAPYGSAHSADNAAGNSSRQNASVVIGKSVQVQARTGDITVAGS
ncbi:hemagglutinin repeat-containing protein, partial [Ralstonia pseudosolanacearum]|uniref:hemagglutinin repeat-containing protein n=1 Tax=Ralstonia pseudosolanacearum TaxID=1310165 RepID=UPI002E1B7AB2